MTRGLAQEAPDVKHFLRTFFGQLFVVLGSSLGSVLGSRWCHFWGQEVAKTGPKRRPKASDAEKAPPAKYARRLGESLILALDRR